MNEPNAAAAAARPRESVWSFHCVPACVCQARAPCKPTIFSVPRSAAPLFSGLTLGLGFSGDFRQERSRGWRALEGRDVWLAGTCGVVAWLSPTHECAFFGVYFAGWLRIVRGSILLTRLFDD